MKLSTQDREALECMPKNEASKIMDEWVGGIHRYTKNNRDWNPLEIMGKYFGNKDLEIKTKLLEKAHELSRR